MDAQLITALTGPVIVFLVLVLTLAMGLRVLRHLRAGRRMPLLLLRDLLLFVTLVVMILGGQYSRATGVRLGQETWWVVLTNGLSITTALVWLGIELALIGRTQDDS